MPPTSQLMRSGSPRLSELAKHLVVPADIASTGWPAVRKTCVEKLGIEFDPWQDGAGRVILAKRDDGNLASMIDGVGLSLPRQVGKTYLIGAMVFALCVNNPGMLVIWSAHHARTHGETFLAMQAFAERTRIQPYVKQVYTGSGDEEIRFHNRSRILFGARERGFGRGIPGVDVLIFDEAQILSDKALSNMLATMNVSRFGLQLYIGTPPKPEDMSESFKRMRREAIAGTLIDGAWIEFGADADADGEDRAQWRMANPSYPKRTPAQSLMRLKRKLAAGDWLREGLGIWDDDQAGSRLITPDEWSDTGFLEPPLEGVKSFGVAFNYAGTRLSLGVGLKHSDGVHVEIVDELEGKRPSIEAGLSDLADWLAARWRDTALIAISGRSHATVLAEALYARGVPRKVVHVLSSAEVFTAAGMLVDGIRDKTVSHWADEGQSRLDDAVAVADKKQRGADGQWAWVATTPDGDETPLEAVSFANWAARTSKRVPGREQVIL